MALYAAKERDTHTETYHNARIFSRGKMSHPFKLRNNLPFTYGLKVHSHREDGISHRQEIIRFNFSFPLDAANEMSVKAQIGLCENRQSVSTYLLRSLAYD